MIPVKIIRKTKATAAAATAAAAQPVDTDSLLPRAIFDDLFQKVIITPEVIDDDGNVTTPTQYAIQANYDLYSIGGISAYGSSQTPAGGSTADIDIEQLLTDGTPVAAINGVTIYAPQAAAGASTWAELTGKPAWLTDTDPGYATLQYTEATYLKQTTLDALFTTVPYDDATWDTAISANLPLLTKKIDTQGYSAKTGQLTVQGTAAFQKTVSFETVTQFGGELQAAGHHAHLGTLTVDGHTDLKGSLTLYDNLTVNDYVQVTGSLTVGSMLNLAGSIKPAEDMTLYVGNKDYYFKGAYLSRLYLKAEAADTYKTILRTRAAAADTTIYLPSSAGTLARLTDTVAAAEYTNQLGATGSTGTVNIYGNAQLKNGSLTAAGNITTDGHLYVAGESHLKGNVLLQGQYTFFGHDGIYVKCDRTAQSFGTAAYIGTHLNNAGGQATVATIEIDGRLRLWHNAAINHELHADASLRVGGVTMLEKLSLSDRWTLPPDNYWFASPNGYFGYPELSSYVMLGGGSLELSDSLPYIDFHWNKNTTADYTSRLIASEDGVLMIASATADPALKIGAAYLRYDSANNALYVTGQNGAQVNLYATGGVSAYSALGSVTQLANLQLTGQLTAASVNVNTIKMGLNEIYDEGQLYLSIGDALCIGGYCTWFDSDGWLYMNSSNEIRLTGGALIRIGSSADNHAVTDLYADGSYVYITVNGKQYKLYCISVTAVS